MWIRLASSSDVGRLDKDKRGGEGNGERMTDTTCSVVCEWIGNEEWRENDRYNLQCGV